VKYDWSLAKLSSAMRQRLLLAALISATLVGLAGAVVSAGQWPLWGQLTGASLLVAALGGWIEHWWNLLQGPPLAAHLNRRWPALEDSAQLLLEPALAPGSIAQRQQQKVSRAVANEATSALPSGAVRSLCLLTAGLILASGVPGVLQRTTGQTSPATARLMEQRLTIRPPAYTGLAEFSTALMDLEVPQNSLLTWQLRFSAGVEEAWLVLDSGERLTAPVDGAGEAIVQQRLTGDQIYQLGWRLGNESTQTEPALIRVIRDQPPALKILAPEFSPQETADPAAEKSGVCA